MRDVEPHSVRERRWRPRVRTLGWISRGAFEREAICFEEG